jgi:hypothetical protein
MAPAYFILEFPNPLSVVIPSGASLAPFWRRHGGVVRALFPPSGYPPSQTPSLPLGGPFLRRQSLPCYFHTLYDE